MTKFIKLHLISLEKSLKENTNLTLSLHENKCLASKGINTPLCYVHNDF